jgi:hypothetical protein
MLLRVSKTALVEAATASLGECGCAVSEVVMWEFGWAIVTRQSFTEATDQRLKIRIE